MEYLKSFDVARYLPEGQYRIIASVVGLLAGFLIVKLLFGSKYRLPPGPRGLPIIGHLHLMGTAPHQTLMNMTKKHGPIIYLKMGVHPAVVVCSSELAKQVLKDQDHHLASRPIFVSGDILAYDSQSTSLTQLNEKWRFMRKVISTELVSPKRLELSKGIRKEELLNAIEDILMEAAKGKLVDFDVQLTSMVLNQTTRFNFRQTYYGSKAKDTAEGAETFQNLVKVIGGTSFFLAREFFPFLSFVDFGGVEKNMRKLAHDADLFYSSILASHRNKDGSYIYVKPADRDFVDTLLAYQRENEDGMEISDTRIKAAIQDIVIASSSTSTATMLWGLAEIMRKPDIYKKLLKELDAVVGRDRLVDESDLIRLEYLRAVVLENFRMHPPVPLLFPHQSDVDVKIGGYDIPAKTRVMVNTYAIHRDPQIWSDPLEFKPDRFIGSTIDVRGKNFELLPFGSGRRMCAGYNLGLQTVELGLAQILHTCELSLPEGMSPEDVTMEEEAGASVTRKDVLMLRVRPRLPAKVYTEAGFKL